MSKVQKSHRKVKKYRKIRYFPDFGQKNVK